MEKFNEFPVSWDVNINLIYRPNPQMNFKLFNYIATENLGMQFDSPSFSGNLQSGNDQWLSNLVCNRMIGKKAVSVTSLSFNFYRQSFRLGNLVIDNYEYLNKLRSDLVMSISNRLKIRSVWSCGFIKPWEISGRLSTGSKQLHPDGSCLSFTITIITDSDRPVLGEGKRAIYPALFVINRIFGSIILISGPTPQLILVSSRSLVWLTMKLRYSNSPPVVFINIIVARSSIRNMAIRICFPCRLITSWPVMNINPI
jgi:hypothetical protein